MACVAAREAENLRTLVHWVVAAGIVAGAASVVPGFRIEGGAVLASTALVIGAANVAVRPLVNALPIPVPMIALGLFYFVLNGLLLKAASTILPGDVMASATGVVGTAALVTIGSLLLFALVGRGRPTRKG